MELLLHPVLAKSLEATTFAFGQTHIFFGPSGQGKRTAAIELARNRNCAGSTKGECASCLAFANGISPDLILVTPEGSSLGIDQVRTLQQTLSLSPARPDSVRVAVIDEAETLTLEAQNALLKLIEEPPPATTMILIATNLEALLPTVRSRSQSLYFPPVSDAAIEQWLTAQQLPVEASVVELAAGAPGLAHQLTKDTILREQYAHLDALASQLLAGGLFERLLQVKDMGTDPTAVAILKHRLAVRAREHSLKGSTLVLVAVERLWRNLRAGVTGRAALEAMVMEV